MSQLCSGVRKVQYDGGDTLNEGHSVTSTLSLRANWPLLLLFVAAVMGIGFVVGLISAPGPYIATLELPPYVVGEPANTIVWFLLCIAFAVAGWRLWLLDSSSPETRLWLATLILSWWFSPVFFVARAPYAALAVIVVLAGLMTIFCLRTWTVDRVSSLLFIPCTVWVIYTAVMTAWVIAIN